MLGPVTESPRTLQTSLPEAVGPRLRALRTGAGRSLTSVAREIGISASALSQIEVGTRQPSVKRLIDIVGALGVPVSAALDDAVFTRRPSCSDDAGGAETSQPLPGVQVALPSADAQLGDGVTYRRLTPVALPGLDLFESTYPPGSSSAPDGEMLTHHGHDTGCIVRGRLTFRFPDGAVEVPAGGTISFPAGRPHRVENGTGEVAVAIWATVSLREG